MDRKRFYNGTDGRWSRKRAAFALFFILVLTVLGMVISPSYDLPQDLTLASARAPAISAASAILIDADDGTVLYEYNADKKMYPASTTKIMTAMVA